MCDPVTGQCLCKVNVNSEYCQACIPGTYNLLVSGVRYSHSHEIIQRWHVSAEMREKVEKESDYVGTSFAKEARDMHDGVVPERPIYGEANLNDAKKLVDDGIPVVPLPFVPKKKAN